MNFFIEKLISGTFLYDIVSDRCHDRALHKWQPVINETRFDEIHRGVL